MPKIVVTEYTFVPATRKVTLTGLSAVDKSRIVSIKNVDLNAYLYQASQSGQAVLAGKTLTVPADTWAAQNSTTRHKLRILYQVDAEPYDDGINSWSELPGKPVVIAGGATKKEARSVISAAGLPAAYLDAAGKADGIVTAVDEGTFHSNFGNTPMKFVNGRMTIEAGSITSGNIAGYVQVDLGAPVTRIGARVFWPAGSGAAIGLIISKNPGWNHPLGTTVSTDAPVHVVITGDGSMVAGRYIRSNGTIGADGRSARVRTYPTFQDRVHVCEVWLVHAEQRLIVTIDGERYCDFVDADFFDDLSTCAVWECFNAWNIAPAQILSSWADGGVPAVPVAVSPHVGGNVPFGMYESSTMDLSTNLTYTTTTNAYESLATLIPTHTFYMPESGKVMCGFSGWLSTTGDVLMRPMSAGGVKVVPAGFAGRINVEMPYTSAAQTSVKTLTWEVWAMTGVATFTRGGSVGPITTKIIPTR